MGRIQRANLDGTNVETLRPEEMRAPKGIALDVNGGKIYWTDTGAIHRADFDGTNAETLISFTEGRRPRSIALDEYEKKIYWTEFAVGENNRWEMGSIQRANFDGTNIEALVMQLDEPKDIVLDIVGSKMYWAEQSYEQVYGTDSYLYRANLKGSDIESIFHLSRWGSAIALGGSTPLPQPTALPTTVLYGHTTRVLSVAFSPDGNILASGSRDDTIRLWDAHTGQLKNTLEERNMWSHFMVLAPDGLTLASAGYENTIALWDMSPYITLSRPTAIELHLHYPRRRRC